MISKTLGKKRKTLEKKTGKKLYKKHLLAVTFPKCHLDLHLFNVKLIFKNPQVKKLNAVTRPDAGSLRLSCWAVCSSRSGAGRHDDPKRQARLGSPLGVRSWGVGGHLGPFSGPSEVRGRALH